MGPTTNVHWSMPANATQCTPLQGDCADCVKLSSCVYCLDRTGNGGGLCLPKSNYTSCTGTFFSLGTDTTCGDNSSTKRPDDLVAVNLTVLGVGLFLLYLLYFGCSHCRPRKKRKRVGSRENSSNMALLKPGEPPPPPSSSYSSTPSPRLLWRLETPLFLRWNRFFRRRSKIYASIEERQGHTKLISGTDAPISTSANPMVLEAGQLLSPGTQKEAWR